MRCDSYCILFNLWCSPGLYHLNQNQRKQAHLFTSRFPAGKVHFSHCFILSWEEIESLKNEKKSWKSPGILFSLFRTNHGPDVTMQNRWNNSISDGCVYVQIRKGLGMHLVTYSNHDTVPFLLIVPIKGRFV